MQTSVIDLEAARFRQAKDVHEAAVPEKFVRRIAEVTANRNRQRFVDASNSDAYFSVLCDQVLGAHPPQRTRLIDPVH